MAAHRSSLQVSPHPARGVTRPAQYSHNVNNIDNPQFLWYKEGVRGRSPPDSIPHRQKKAPGGQPGATIRAGGYERCPVILIPPFPSSVKFRLLKNPHRHPLIRVPSLSARSPSPIPVPPIAPPHPPASPTSPASSARSSIASHPVPPSMCPTTAPPLPTTSFSRNISTSAGSSV